MGSIISIATGGTANLLGIWAKTKFHWRICCIIMLITTCADTIYMAYETQWHVDADPAQAAAYAANPLAPPLPDTRQIWLIVFGWAGCVCHLVASITCLVANQQPYRMSRGNDIVAN